LNIRRSLGKKKKTELKERRITVIPLILSSRRALVEWPKGRQHRAQFVKQNPLQAILWRS